MAMSIKGIDATLSTFREIDRRFTEAAGDVLEEGAKDISEWARKFAPIDKGHLVKSIRAQRVKDPYSTKWRIKVGGVIAGRDVSAYASLVHERMRITHGEPTRRKGEKGDGFNPGWRSQKKARELGVPVGKKFLQRAYDMHVKSIEKALREALRRETARFSRRNRSNRRSR